MSGSLVTGKDEIVKAISIDSSGTIIVGAVIDCFLMKGEKSEIVFRN